MAIIKIEGKNWKYETGLSEAVAIGLRSLITAIVIEKESLSTSQSEGTELSFKVPSQSSDEPCPDCGGTKQDLTTLKTLFEKTKCRTCK